MGKTGVRERAVHNTITMPYNKVVSKTASTRPHRIVPLASNGGHELVHARSIAISQGKKTKFEKSIVTNVIEFLYRERKANLPRGRERIEYSDVTATLTPECRNFVSVRWRENVIRISVIFL